MKKILLKNIIGLVCLLLCISSQIALAEQEDLSVNPDKEKLTSSSCNSMFSTKIKRIKRVVENADSGELLVFKNDNTFIRINSRTFPNRIFDSDVVDVVANADNSAFILWTTADEIVVWTNDDETSGTEFTILEPKRRTSVDSRRFVGIDDDISDLLNEKNEKPVIFNIKDIIPIPLKNGFGVLGDNDTFMYIDPYKIKYVKKSRYKNEYMKVEPSFFDDKIDNVKKIVSNSDGILILTKDGKLNRRFITLESNYGNIFDGNCFDGLSDVTNILASEGAFLVQQKDSDFRIVSAFAKLITDPSPDVGWGIRGKITDFVYAGNLHDDLYSRVFSVLTSDGMGLVSGYNGHVDADYVYPSSQLLDAKKVVMTNKTFAILNEDSSMTTIGSLGDSYVNPLNKAQKSIDERKYWKRISNKKFTDIVACKTHIAALVKEDDGSTSVVIMSDIGSEEVIEKVAQVISNDRGIAIRTTEGAVKLYDGGYSSQLVTKVLNTGVIELYSTKEGAFIAVKEGYDSRIRGIFPDEEYNDKYIFF